MLGLQRYRTLLRIFINFKYIFKDLVVFVSLKNNSVMDSQKITKIGGFLRMIYFAEIFSG